MSFSFQAKHGRAARATFAAFFVTMTLSAAFAIEPAPTTAPTSAPTTDTSTDPLLPPEFEIFQSRSAFATDGRATSAPSASPDPPAAQAAFVLRGIAQIDDHFIALFEGPDGKNAIQAAVGDSLASGHVKSIDLDQVQYESAGQLKQIAVGQNLNGEVVPRAPATQPAPPSDNAAANPDDAGPPDDGQPQPPQPPHSHPRRAK
jgi:hypothetical protein